MINKPNEDEQELNPSPRTTALVHFLLPYSLPGGGPNTNPLSQTENIKTFDNEPKLIMYILMQ